VTRDTANFDEHVLSGTSPRVDSAFELLTPVWNDVANKKRICYLAAMSVRSCRVTIQDMDGVSHTVDVTAATLYEAVAQGLSLIRKGEWVAGIAQGLNVVKVSVADVRVEHEVKLMDFTKWLERPGGSPREVSDRHRIRAILGMPISRTS
jgi:hypothetical protein